jgi:hypothetical protein
VSSSVNGEVRGPLAAFRAVVVSKCQIEIAARLPVEDPTDTLSYAMVTGGMFAYRGGNYWRRTATTWTA